MGTGLAADADMAPASSDSNRETAVRRESKRDENDSPDDLIRRGLLYSLLAAVLYYFAGGYSEWTITIEVGQIVQTVLLPLLFLSGVGMVIRSSIPWLK